VTVEKKAGGVMGVFIGLMLCFGVIIPSDSTVLSGDFPKTLSNGKSIMGEA
jgi:hypothetical protein